jgi:hypothetical protein
LGSTLKCGSYDVRRFMLNGDDDTAIAAMYGLVWSVHGRQVRHEGVAYRERTRYGA